MENKNNSELICLNDVERKEVSYLWYPYLPQGKIVNLEGDPGVGKSYFTLYLTTQLSNGKSLGLESSSTEASNVVILSAEDDPSDSLRPRLEDMGANLSKVFIYSSSLALGEDGINKIESFLIDKKPKLLIIDPIQCYMGKKDANKMTDVRSILSPLANICQKHSCTCILVRHLNKSGSKAQYRGNGSVDFTAAARSALMIGLYQGSKILFHTKSNYSANGQSLTFSINNHKLIIEGVSNVNPDLVFSTTPSAEPTESKSEVAKEKILKMFSENKEGIPTKLLESTLSEGLGISQKTVERACKELGLESYQKERVWWKKLPNTTPPTSYM